MGTKQFLMWVCLVWWVAGCSLTGASTTGASSAPYGGKLGKERPPLSPGATAGDSTSGDENRVSTSQDKERPAPLNTRVVCGCELLNVRERPGVDAAVVGWLRVGDRVLVGDGREGGWVEVGAGAGIKPAPTMGWVNGGYLCQP